MTSDLSPARHRVTGAGGVGINVWDHGGAGPPLLLVHCTGTHGRIWDPLVPELAKRFHPIAVDTRGHGDSDKPGDDSAYEWALSGEDLLQVVDALELDSGLSAVGHSAGGAHIAYAEHLRPGLFSRVLLLDPILGPPHAFPKPNPLAVLSRKRVNDFPDKAAARARYASKPPMNAWTDDMLDAYVEFGFADKTDGTVTLKCPGHIEALVYDGSGIPELWDHLAEVRFAGALVTASESNVRPLVELQRGRFPNLTFECLEGYSHFIPQEAPESVLQLAGKYLTTD